MEETVRPNISEFSYGYALTEELINWHGTQLTAAPLFPSLYQEGQQGGGFDLKLERPGIPLFLQFKLSDCMVRKSAKEIKNGDFSAPCYRMHIRPARHSQQHEMLLDLENRRNEVYYCAPAFHSPEELNDAYLNHLVRDKSLWLRPSVIGPLTDDRDHHVAFQVPGVHRFCSESRILDTKGNFSEFSRQIELSYRQKSKSALSENSLVGLAKSLQSITEKRSDISRDSKRRTDIELQK
ncbi:unnamed protein product, partial [marine sediment metagenome]